MTDIVLCTLNARWSHASLGLRYLLANLGAFEARACIEEFTLRTPVASMCERLLAHQPTIIGFGVYVWNVAQTTALIRTLRNLAPQVKIVLGGPEVSHETGQQEIVRLADHVITGAAEAAFTELVRQLLEGPRPLMKVIAGGEQDLERLTLPYALYSDQDLQQRHLYFEASRGCPYKCSFCLSALDRSAFAFPLERVLEALRELIRRGARRIRFVDRTFNLRISTSQAILNCLLEHNQAHPDDPVFAHFELVPDHLPQALKDTISAFAPGALQFEIGIQSWNPKVQKLVARRQDNAQAEENLRWLREHSHTHLHVDLIAGLPGESLASFAEGFDRLYALRPQEIQVGILKRLRGTPMTHLQQEQGLQFEEDPPYAVHQTREMTADEVVRMTRFAQAWDRLANSGRFAGTLQAWLGPTGGATSASATKDSTGSSADGSAFARFMAFCDHLHAQGHAVHHTALEALAGWLAQWLAGQPGWSAVRAQALLEEDYRTSGARGRLPFMNRGLSGAAPSAP
ncbi:MAG: B12-binding domain-containing radical SAM protein [Burkholderiaceae bacterium]